MPVFGNNKPPTDPGDVRAVNAYLMQELDEIKRYVANTYQQVDTEINEIRDIVKQITSDVKDNDRQLDRMEKYERSIRNIEQMCRNLERRVK